MTHPPYNLALKILSYFIILFPSIDVISIYPLMVMTMINNLYVVIFRKDSAQAGETWKGYILLLLLKLIAALLPLLVAMAVSNLVEVLKFAGLTSIVLTYLFPAVLQLTSQWVCKKTFTKALESNEEMESALVPDQRSNNGSESARETSPLVSPPQTKPSDLYMTPYSNIFSYWPAAAIMGLMGLALFLVSIPGIVPDKYF